MPALYRGPRDDELGHVPDLRCACTSGRSRPPAGVRGRGWAAGSAAPTRRSPMRSRGYRRVHHGPQDVRRWDGRWEEAWTGWWGEEPPYHAPVFVLTHHPRAPLEMRGGTKPERRPGAATSRSPAGPAPCGNASRPDARRALPAHRPIILGAGERLLEGVGDPTWNRSRWPPHPRSRTSSTASGARRRHARRVR
jgi:hypothetical protein